MRDCYTCGETCGVTCGVTIKVELVDTALDAIDRMNYEV